MPILLESPWIQVDRPEGATVRVRFLNQWNTAQCGNLPQWADVVKKIGEGESVKQLSFETGELGAWDSELPAFVMSACDWAKMQEAEVSIDALPEGVQKIVALARSSIDNTEAKRHESGHSLIYRIGACTLRIWAGVQSVFDFTGEVVFSLRRWLTAQAKFRWKDVWLIVQKCGADALPIVTLISFLVGMILAYVGVVQLQQFGATIYVANLVAIAMVREMGAIMTGVIMSGRTGAAFAAELGSMKVSEEISALRTFGISPYDFLIMPRLLAVVAMMPLLVLYANIMGILGGGVVAVSMGLTTLQYMTQAVQALDMGAFSVGLIKSVVFGIIVGFTGCLRGIHCGNSSESVGRSTTSAVVTSITWIIIADAIFAVLFNIFGL